MSQQRPYRELALVPTVVEPAPLWSWYHQERPVECPKACRETREHFHVKCLVCGWSTIMAPRDSKA